MLVRRLARPMLAAVFIYGGIGVLRDVRNHAKAASHLMEKAPSSVQDSVPEQVPSDPETLVRIDGAVKIGGGVLLALGKCPRFAALLLAGSLVPTTLSSHAFWELDDPGERAGQQIHFLKNVGLLGGLLITAVDHEGRPSVGYRARHRADRVAAQAHQAKGAAKLSAEKGRRKAGLK
ncbi:DoxX family protein [Saccharopolyspora sp. CA-218241]|uniref:DoxX family protein n=1 Tax=Saccharopolyspora sp. CA-218241 TaxID=3240027 RepID=UPI003D981CB9